MKKIALVTSGLGTRAGGIGVVAQMIVSELGRDHEIIIWEHPPFWPRIFRIPTVLWRTGWGSLKKPDLVIYDHVHLSVLHHLVPTLRRIPYVVFLHGVEVWEPLAGRRRQALEEATLLLTNSSTTERNARSFNPWLPKPTITWLGVPPQPEPTNILSTKPVALMVGRMVGLERYKGHDEVMNAWPLIRAAVPDAKLFLLGKGDDAGRLQARVKNERLEGIEFLGYVSDELRDQIYRSSRLLIFPSKGEGFGLAGVEAASFGLPVLGLAGTVTEELFPDQLGALILKDLSPQPLADAIIRLLSSAEDAARIGEAGRSRVNELFLEAHFKKRLREALLPLL